MRYLSVCSGIEAATVAWAPLGWRPLGVSEIEPFARAVLAQRLPYVPQLGDLHAHRSWPFESGDVELLVGGTPCQSFSVAGLRNGLDDPRGKLALVYIELARRIRPRWILWENVPGVLSADRGRAFGSFLGGLAELGYGFAWRVLDARYFGLAQQRKRVFLVGRLGDWRGAAAVLFERASMQGNPGSGRAARPSIARGAPPRALSRGGGSVASSLGANSGRAQIEQTYLPVDFSNACARADAETMGTLMAAQSKGNRGYGLLESEAPIAFDRAQITHPENRSRPLPGGPAPAVGSEPSLLAFNVYPAGGQGADLEASPTTLAASLGAVSLGRSTDRGTRILDSRASTAESGPSGARFLGQGLLPLAGAVAGTATRRRPTGARVRRLTPTECERLQGFPDGWTDIDFESEAARDGRRYKALGNSIAVPVLRWIGLRMQAVDQITGHQQAQIP